MTELTSVLDGASTPLQSLIDAARPLGELLDDPVLTDPTGVLEQALQSAQALLTEFAATELADAATRLAAAFGSQFDPIKAIELLQSWSEAGATTLPAIEIRSGSELNNAYAAYSAETNTIYLSREFLTRHAHTVSTVTDVVLEEIGHFIDAQLNASDSLGDEGAIFSTIVQGIDLDASALHALTAEDDSVVLTLDGDVFQAEQATPGVNAAFDLIGLTQMRNDPRFAGIDGSGFSVAVIDTGLDRTHPLLQPNYVTGVDFVNGGDNPIDREGHGTHVSGTIGARDENIGVAPDVRLIGLQVFEQSGGAYNSTIESALEWVLANHQQYNIIAVNMSLGSGFYTDPSQVQGDILIDDIRRLEAAGITVVSAAGNSYKNNEYQNFGAPAIESTLAVGAVWKDSAVSGIQFGSGSIDYTTGADRVTSFSQRLVANNTIFAPGALINSTVPGGGLEDQAGTSMASPIVAGAVALMQEAAVQFGGRVLTPAEVAEIMRSTANAIFDGDDEDDNVQNTNVNYPRLNVLAAIEEIQRRFGGIAPPSGDPNGTLQGALVGPTLDGSLVPAIVGAIGVDGSGTAVGDKDVDIVRFEVVSPGEVTIELGSDPNNPADFDSYLRLFDASGNQIAADDDGVATGGFSRITTTLNPGTYYAGVSGFDNSAYNPTVAGSGVAGSTGNYSLQFRLNNADPNGLISGAVAVNLGTDREPLLFNGLIGADYGSPVGTSDVDLFKIVVPDDGTLLIDIDTPYDDNYVDSYLRLFDAEGNELFFPGGDPFASDDDRAFDAFGNDVEFVDPNDSERVVNDRATFEGHRTDSFLGALVERGETYYIGVSDFANQDYDSTNLNNRPTTGPGGRYDLIVSFFSNDQNGSITQALRQAALSQSVTNVAESIGFDADRQTGDLIEVGDRDVDFFRISSPTEGILEINIDSYVGATVSTPVDAVVLLFDANGNQLALNDDTDSLDPLLQYQIAANTDYFAAVVGYGNDSFDPFQLGSGSSGDTGDYFFSSRVLPLSQNTLLSNDRVGNGAVQDIAIGATVAGSVGRDSGFVVGASDIDIYRFVPTASGFVDIRTNTSEEFSADTYLRFFDANGNQIAANDNQTSTNRGSFVQANVTAGATYYIGVNGASAAAGSYNPLTGAGAAPGSQGGYTLSIANATTIVPPPPPQVVNFVGTDAGETVAGSTGNDSISGGGGSDRITGLSGDDSLTGGLGADVITGNEGSDRFVFSAATRSGALAASRLAARDQITDFQFSQGDRFVLDFDNNLATLNRPKALFNSGRERAGNLGAAVRAAYADKNQRVRGRQTLAANEAVLFSWRGRSYLSINDGSRGFAANRDFLADVTGIGLKPGDARAGALAVANYFA